jgi:hypothetical protein
VTEVRSVSSTGGEKGTKLERFDLIPTEALAKVARHYGVGAQKYSEHNWRKGYEWSKSFAALQRHANQFWGGEDFDDETGSPHMAAVVFHALALLTFMDEHPDFDDRFKPNLGAVSDGEFHEAQGRYGDGTWSRDIVRHPGTAEDCPECGGDGPRLVLKKEFHLPAESQDGKKF